MADDDDDDLNFENDASLDGNSSVRSSQGSTTSSILNSKYGRTKSQRRKMRLSQQSNEEESQRTVRFSLSPGRDSLDSALSSNTRRRRRRKKTFARRPERGSEDNDDDERDSSQGSSSSHGSNKSRSSSQSSLSRQSHSSPQRFSQDSLPSRSSSRFSQDSYSSSQNSYEYSPHEEEEEVNVRGAGTDVLAVQDAGSYRMLFDDVSYLCSTITANCNSSSALDAACDLGILLGNNKTRAILMSFKEGGAALTAILETLTAVTEPESRKLDGILGVMEQADARQNGDYDLYCNGSMLSPNGKRIDPSGADVPKTKTGRKRALERLQDEDGSAKKSPRNPLLYEALAAVLHFLSWDCTVTEHSSVGNATKARQVRSVILQHPAAVRCACHLALMDPVVDSVLSASNEPTNGGKSGGLLLLSSPTKSDRDDNDDASRASSIETRDSLTTSHGGDLTLQGRKRRRKKRRIQIGQKKAPQLKVIEEDQEFAFPDSPVKQPAVQVNMHMSFTSDDDESLSNQRRRGEDASVSTAASEQVAEKLAQVRAAIVQPETSGGEDQKVKEAQHTCGRAVSDDGREQSSTANLLAGGVFVLKSISRIIDGKEGDDISCIENEADGGDGNVKRSSQDAATNEQDDDDEEQLRKNPLLITNTLLRKGGALPVLARAMAETLSSVIAIVLADDAACIECLSHLKHRVALLAPLIDGACCLTSDNRKELCGDGSQLLSSILLFLKTFSDTENNRPPLVASLLDEIALSTLRTLTSLTHDNGLARNLMMMCYKVNAVESSVPMPGVLILCNLIWKTVTNSKQSQLHSAYDMVIFCLNTLSNVVEAKNLRRMLSEYKVPITDSAASSREELFLAWLARWLFLETTSFRNAVMRGTFGQNVSNQAATLDTSYEMRDLEKDDEEHLITAGNGFIFMTCLMIDSKDAYPEDAALFSTIRETILKELQVNDDKDDSSLLLIKNTLKAFCNFYHYSLGDLSVAIVAPVGQLIAELERMQQPQGKAAEQLKCSYEYDSYSS